MVSLAAPRISVLLPIKNVAPYLAFCLRSLRWQTFSDFEVWAIDDHSTDDTALIFKQETKQDPRFHLAPATGQGLVAALNQAAACARGAWLARMDGDDICHPLRFEKQLQYAEQHPDAAIIGSLVRIFPTPLPSGMARYERWLNGIKTNSQIRESRWIESPLAHPTVLMKRTVFEDMGGYRDLGWAEDYDLWLRFMAAGHQIEKTPRILLFWRDTLGRTSRTYPEYKAAAFRRCKLHHLRQSFSFQHGCALLGVGSIAKPWAWLLRREGISVRAFIDVHQPPAGKTIRGVPVHGYEHIPALGPVLILAAVGREGAREDIEARLKDTPLRPDQQLIYLA